MNIVATNRWNRGEGGGNDNESFKREANFTKPKSTVVIKRTE